MIPQFAFPALELQCALGGWAGGGGGGGGGGWRTGAGAAPPPGCLRVFQTSLRVNSFINCQSTFGVYFEGGFNFLIDLYQLLT